MRTFKNILVVVILAAISCCQSGCAEGKDFSTTYHAHFFGLYKPKARHASTPQRAFATGFRSHDPFSRRQSKSKYKTNGDGYHTIVRHMRTQHSMGKPAEAQGLFFKRKTMRRRSPAREDKQIFGKYQRKAKREHGKH